MEGGWQSLSYGLLPIHLIKEMDAGLMTISFAKKKKKERKLMNKVYARTLREFKIHDLTINKPVLDLDLKESRARFVMLPL